MLFSEDGSSEPQVPRRAPVDDRHHLRTALFLLTAAALGWFNWRVPVVRLGWQPLNQVVLLLVFLAPTGALPVLLRIRNRRWMVRAAAALVALPAAFSLLLGLFTAIDLADTVRRGVDPAFEPVRMVHAEGYALRVYRTNGGAMTAFGVVVRQERTVFPGLRLVRDVYQKYPGEDAAVTRIAPGTYSFDGKAPVGPLARHVWF